MPCIRFALFAAAVVLTAHGASTNAAAAYPDKPVRMIVSFAPGGPADILARAISQKLSERMGQQVVVDNRAGASGNIAAEVAARAAPDGHTLFLSTAGVLTVNPTLFKMPVDTVKDFAPITLAATITSILVVHPSLGVKTVKELIQLAKAKPGQLSYGSAGNGAASHLAMELFKSTAGIDMLHVPYKGAAPAITDLVGGQVQVMLIGVPVAMPQVRAGKLTALGIASLKRSPFAPELPTIADSGLPGFEVSNWLGVLAPAGTPREIVNRLNREIVDILRQPDVKERLFQQGFETVVSTPEQFAAYMRTELGKWAKVIKQAGIKPG